MMHKEGRDGSNQSYLYESKRVNGKVQKVYLGNFRDPFTATLHELTSARKREEAFQHQQATEEKKRSTFISQHCDFLAKAIEHLDVLALLLQIAHHHEEKCMEPRPSLGNPYDLVNLSFDDMPTQTQFAKLRRLADSGDEDAIVELRQLVRSAPELLREQLDLLSITKEVVIEAIADGSQATRVLLEEQLNREVDAYRQLIGGNQCEDMLAEIAILYRFEALRTYCKLATASQSHNEIRFWESMSGNALKRYEKCLARLTPKVRSGSSPRSDSRRDQHPAATGGLSNSMRFDQDHARNEADQVLDFDGE